MPQWVLLSYRVPRDPTAARVHVWRRLQRLGAVLVHGSVSALPRTPGGGTLEQMQWLASEIQELNGQAMVWIASAFPDSGDAALIAEFRERADAEFARIAAKASRRSRNLEVLAREFREACVRDYFQSPHREQARLLLMAAPSPVGAGGGGGGAGGARGGEAKRGRARRKRRSSR